MRTRSLVAMALGVVGAAALLLTFVGGPGTPRPPTRAVAPPSVPTSVAAGGFTLTSAAVELPDDDQPYPAGPHAEVVNDNCTACHSASMALSQPALTAEQWRAEVTKMREVYKAPVADADVASIVAYLATLGSDRRTSPATDTRPQQRRTGVGG